MRKTNCKTATHATSIFLLPLFVFILIGPCFSQQLAFNHFSVESGLSQSAALSIAQDAQGFIWVGTRGGLNKYDTRGFTVYKNNPADSHSISDNYISALLGDSHGSLWIGTRNGLNKYNRENASFDRLGNNTLTGSFINCLFEDRHKNLWVGTNNGLNLLADRKSNRFKPFLHAQAGTIGYDITSIAEDQLGNIWLGTTTGLLKIGSGKDFANMQVFRHQASNPSSLADNIIMALMVDERQNLWIGTAKSGLELFNKANSSFTHYVKSTGNSLINDNIRKMVSDTSGNIWIGTQEGLSVFNPSTNRFTNYTHDPDDKKSLSQNSIHSLFKDKNGTMWVGTFFGGVNTVYTNAFALYQNNKLPNSLSNNVVSSMVEDAQHNLWVGTEGGGLNYFNPQANSFTHYKNIAGDSTSLPSNLIKVVYGDKSGHIWVGTNAGGLCVFDAAANRFRRFQNVNQAQPTHTSGTEIVTMQEDSHHRIWMGSQSGLTYISSQHAGTYNRTSPAPFTLPNSDVHYLFEDSQHNLWIGTAAGLHVLNNQTQQLQSFTHNGTGKKAIQTAFVNCITEDDKGGIWIGTAFSGLAKYNANTKNLDFYTEKNGLPSNNVLGILVDDQGFLWVSTDNGLAKFDPGEKTFNTYTAADGLAGDQFNYNSFLKDSKGRLYFGGYNGITTFFPADIETNKHTAALVFTGLKLFNEPVPINTAKGLLQQNISLTKSLQLKYNQNIFSIDFALLSFVKSEKNKYSHQLEGFDKGWIESPAGSASYTNVPPGNYTFRVKAANNDGLWSRPVALQIEILPPFWRTWWAYLFYILLAAAIVFFITRFLYLRALIKKEDDLHQVKLNFFTNISHEIRTHLTLIMAPVDKLLDSGSQDSFNQQKHQLKNVRTNANRLLKLVSELMDFRKAETNNLKLQLAEYNLVDFLQGIFSSFQNLSLTKNIDASFVHPTNSLTLYFDPEQLEKVFFNLLTNAFKFTPEGGKIILAVGQKNNEAIVTITDNGRGIAPEYLDKLFNNFFQVADHGLQNTGYGIGLALAKNIVELHKGTIAVESKPATAAEPGKTSFSVALPLGKQHIAENLLTAPFTLPVKDFTNEIVVPQTAEAGLAVTEKLQTILIAEDNAALRQLVKETFEQQFNIIETENGQLGWEQAIEQVPDIIISDVMMPEMDGFTLCGKLKTDERTSHIPVILLTAKSAHTDQINGLENGADIYLTKPFSTKVLELHVRNLLASRERMRLRYSQQILPSPIAESSEAAEAVPYMNPIDKEFLDKMESLTDEYMDDPEFGVEMLCRKVAMSRPVLYKKLKAVTNLSVNDFVKSLRLKKAAELLAQKRYTVYEVSYAVGYNDSKYFSREFKKLYGKSPSEYGGVEVGKDEE